MRLRSSAGESDSPTRESASDATGPASSARPVRTFLLVAGGTAAVAYAVSRLRSSSDGDAVAEVDAPLETVRNRTAAAVPDEVGDRVSAAVPNEVSERVAETVPDEVDTRVSEAVPDEVSDRIAESVPADSQAIPIGDSNEDESEADTGSENEDSGADADAAPDVGDVGEVVDDEEMNADLADEPSSTKISSGSSDEIQERPAEPGEMAVEDDVEELVDDDLESEEAADDAEE